MRVGIATDHGGFGLKEELAAHLRAAQWQVLEARSGEAAIALLNAGKHVDVVVTDIELGGSINGWSVGERFRTILPEIAVIYTSGKAWPSAQAVPRSLFISKPYEPDAIAQACQITLCEARPRC